MKTNLKIFNGTLAVGLLVALGTFAISVPASWDSTAAAFHWPLAGDALMACLHIGAAILFALSLGVYKAKLRLAFMGIVLGILLIAAGTIQLPVIDILGEWESTYVTHGLIGLPFMISGLTLYFGAAGFARLVGDKSRWTQKSLVLAAVLVLIALSTALPHVQTTLTETTYDAANAVFIWTMLLILAATVVIWRVRRRIGAHYKSAMTWLSAALLASTLTVLIAVVDTYATVDPHDFYSYALTAMAAVAGLLWLSAGNAFTATKEY